MQPIRNNQFSGFQPMADDTRPRQQNQATGADHSEQVGSSKAGSARQYMNTRRPDWANRIPDYLDLVGKQLKELPAELFEMTKLTRLRLGHNQISELPAALGELKELTSLDLSANQISVLPAALGGLEELKALYLSNNKISELPAEVSELKALTSLDLSANQISVFPAVLGGFNALKALYLRDNQISVLSAELGGLKALKTLDLSHNQISALPDSIRNLRHLNRLDLSNNRFTTVPDMLLDLSSDTEIFLRNNPLPPDEIRRIHDAVQTRRRQGLDAPTFLLPGLPQEADLENALRAAADADMSVHMPGLTANIARRLAKLATQLPQHLAGDVEAQRAEMRQIGQRLAQALSQHGAEPPALEKARKTADRMFASGLGTRQDFYNDFQRSAGHVLSYVYLAMEKQWDDTPEADRPQAQANGITQLMQRLGEANRWCDTRMIEEVFQLVGMPLSDYAQAHPEIVISAPMLSNAELSDVLLPEATRIYNEVKPALQAETNEREAFRAAFAKAMEQHSSIMPEQWQSYLNDHIFGSWDDFRGIAAEAAGGVASASTSAQIMPRR
ncbi:MAG TPA: leucine-rich repeat domain-containing protein [Noviherbaspirillum sp.]|jgi:hypothetical protein|uniref:leucine-rich repeat domain-containing protein n=1 Tax=Noviherbaspirillum sp. TaxID=1926288 RepID=UPI002DDD5655|nr:leucine-rich repeat domain-containing protein [Noviherbaspirillum sp.]HEV2611924.1 leucine-rich repeat domain-containing protein [Noviherbaspirillum sp.]